jgi:HPt (histidine-containing phosphotransfer) domain-containing protein
MARFGDNAGRQRAMNAEGHLLLVLHDPPNPNDQGRQAKLLWRAPDGAWACNNDGSDSDLLKKHVANFAKRAEFLENKMQEASCADDYFFLLQAIAPLHRSSRNLHATLQQARDMIAEDRAIIVARDSAADIERTFELLHLDAKNGLDYTVARKSELQSQQSYEMALSAHRLNVLAAIFFPITALSSIFAMNPTLAPESLLHTPIFWTVVGAGSLCGLLLSRSIVQRPREKKESLKTIKNQNDNKREANQKRSGNQTKKKRETSLRQAF